MIIDAHQHFWRPERGDYGWLTPELTPLYRRFMPVDLAPFLREYGIDGTVLVQAAPTVAETDYLLGIADATPFVLGVVGWVDFADARAVAEIGRLDAHPKLIGLRPMIQDIEDIDWMLRPDLAPAFEAMTSHDLTFDALVLPRHLPNLRKLMARYPDLRVVIDHAAKPEIADGQFDVWAKDIARLAHETSAYCKFSGLLTEAGDTWTLDDLRPYVTHLFAHFGATRLVWGSDWPVVTLAASYGQWLSVAQSLVGEAAAGRVFGENAKRLYGLAQI